MGKNGSICSVLDRNGDLLYSVMTSSEKYPKTLANDILADFSELVHKHCETVLSTAKEGTLGLRLRPFVDRLLKTYSERCYPGSDKSNANNNLDFMHIKSTGSGNNSPLIPPHGLMAKKPEKILIIKQRADEIKLGMQDNIKKALDNNLALDDLHIKAEMMSECANNFKTTTRHVRRHFWWKNKKFGCFICCSFTVILGLVVAYCVLSHRSSSMETTEMSTSLSLPAPGSAISSPQFVYTFSSERGNSDDDDVVVVVPDVGGSTGDPLNRETTSTFSSEVHNMSVPQTSLIPMKSPTTNTPDRRSRSYNFSALVAINRDDDISTSAIEDDKRSSESPPSSIVF